MNGTSSAPHIYKYVGRNLIGPLLVMALPQFNIAVAICLYDWNRRQTDEYNCFEIVSLGVCVWVCMCVMCMSFFRTIKFIFSSIHKWIETTSQNVLCNLWSGETETESKVESHTEFALLHSISSQNLVSHRKRKLFSFCSYFIGRTQHAYELLKLLVRPHDVPDKP